MDADRDDVTGIEHVTPLVIVDDNLDSASPSRHHDVLGSRSPAAASRRGPIMPGDIGQSNPALDPIVPTSRNGYQHGDARGSRWTGGYGRRSHRPDIPRPVDVGSRQR